MNKKQLKEYEQKFTGLSINELEDKLFQAYFETPDGKLDLELIEALVTILEEIDPTPENAGASYYEFREKHIELFDQPAIPYIKHSRRFLPFRKIILVAVIAVLLIGSLSAYAYRLEILNWFETTNEKYTRLQTDDPAQTLIEHWHGCYIPAYIPEGFSLVDAVDLNDFRFLQYESGKDKMLTFYQYSPSSSIQLDTEDVTDIKEVAIGEYQTRQFQKEGTSTVYWDSQDDSGYSFSLEFNQGAVDQSEIKDLINGLTWRP